MTGCDMTTSSIGTESPPAGVGIGGVPVPGMASERSGGDPMASGESTADNL